MGLPKPYFDRSKFDGWSHEEMVDAYIGLYFRVMNLEGKVARLDNENRDSGEWYINGQPAPHTPADGQW